MCPDDGSTVWLDRKRRVGGEPRGALSELLHFAPLLRRRDGSLLSLFAIRLVDVLVGALGAPTLPSAYAAIEDVLVVFVIGFAAAEDVLVVTVIRSGLLHKYDSNDFTRDQRRSHKIVRAVPRRMTVIFSIERVHEA
jgi:hypothetical protein